MPSFLVRLQEEVADSELRDFAAKFYEVFPDFCDQQLDMNLFTKKLQSLLPPGSGVSPQPIFAAREWGEQRTLVANRAIKAGTEVYCVPRRPEFTRESPDMHTLQVGLTEHLDFAAALPDAALTHHSCDPNGDLQIHEHGVIFVARRDIAAEEILSFDYATTEWDMDEKFPCACGATDCLGTVGGWKHLSEEQRVSRLARASPVVLERANAV